MYTRLNEVQVEKAPQTMNMAEAKKATEEGLRNAERLMREKLEKPESFLKK
jgi:hypothetical protein